MSVLKHILFVLAFLVGGLWLYGTDGHILNPIPFLIGYGLYRYGVITKLCNRFDKQDVKTAVIILGCSFLLFFGIMHYFAVFPASDFFYGTDQGRVVYNLSVTRGDHYRIAVHPFFLLVWQTAIKALMPIKPDITLIRVFITAMAAVNMALFYLWLREFIVSRKAAVFGTTLLALSFSQITHAALFIESFIFSQTTILVTVLCFSRLYKKPRLKLLPQLVLALFAFSTTITNIVIYGLCLLILLIRMKRENKITGRQAVSFCTRFAVLFLIIANFLFILQNIIFCSFINDLIGMFQTILEKEPTYIALPSGHDFKNYIQNFFIQIWGKQTPLSNLPKQTLWMYGLLVPFFLSLPKRLKTPDFWTVCGAIVFFFTLHLFYGVHELEIYAPTFVPFIVALFAWAADSVGAYFKKLYTAAALCVLLVTLGCIYPVLEELKIVNNFMYAYHSTSRTLLVDDDLAVVKGEILKAHRNRHLNLLVFNNKNLETLTDNIYYFGLGNRRKLVFRNNELSDFKTGEVLLHLDNIDRVTVLPHLYTVRILFKNDAKIEITEDENGVFFWVKNKRYDIPGTQIQMDFPNFDSYEYPNLLKMLYQEILFAVIDGKVYPRLHEYHTRPEVVWYRDSALIGYFLKEFNHIDLIADWIKTRTNVYDNIRYPVQEPDNLGNIIYLNSLLEKPNHKTVERAVKEARRIAQNGCLQGLTDSQPHNRYQTEWLQFALTAYGRADWAAEFGNCPDNGRTYHQLLWFTQKPQNNTPAQPVTLSRLEYITYAHVVYHLSLLPTFDITAPLQEYYPYIQVDKAHFDMLNTNTYQLPNVTSQIYPLSWGDHGRPHAWHAFSLFYYLKEFKKETP